MWLARPVLRGDADRVTVAWTASALLAGVGLSAAVGQAQSAVSKAGRKGKSLVRGGSGSGSALAGLGAGGAMGMALTGEDEGGDVRPPGQSGTGQVQNQVAPAPEATSAVGAQTSLGQYTDEELPEQTARPDAGQEYSAPDAGTTTTDSGQSDVPSLSEIDVDAATEAEFATAFADASPKERAKLVQDALQGSSNSQRFLSEAMGPAGGAIATVAMGAVGLSGGAAAAAGVVPAAAIAYAGKQSIQHDSVRKGLTNTVKAPVQLGKQAQQELTNRFGFSKQSAAGSGGGSSDSGGNNGFKYNQ